MKATGYTAAGRELTVTFTGGVCARYDVTADEGADEVTVTVTETSDPGKVCVLIAEEQELTVRLAKPLGDRAVVGPDGERIPLAGRGARLPEPGR
ncbi:Membrane protein OS=Streptomyces fumanus OX=67302 GN=GCM10018772_00050 PE=4 SV=1 [Streptomyces fumanus]